MRVNKVKITVKAKVNTQHKQRKSENISTIKQHKIHEKEEKPSHIESIKGANCCSIFPVNEC